MVLAMTLCRARKKRRPSMFCHDIWREKEKDDLTELECVEEPVELPSELEPQELEGDYPLSYSPVEVTSPIEGQSPLESEESPEPISPERAVEEQGCSGRRSREPETQRRARPSAIPKLRISQPSPPGSSRRTSSYRNNVASKILVPPRSPIPARGQLPWSADDITATRTSGRCDSNTNTIISPRSPRNTSCSLFSCLCWREHTSDVFNPALSRIKTQITSDLAPTPSTSSHPDERRLNAESDKEVWTGPPMKSFGYGKDLEKELSSTRSSFSSSSESSYQRPAMITRRSRELQPRGRPHYRLLLRTKSRIREWGKDVGERQLLARRGRWNGKKPSVNSYSSPLPER